MKVYEYTVGNAYVFYGYIDEIDLERAMAQVSIYRRNKVRKLRNIKDKKLSIMAELLLLYGLDELCVSHNLPLEFAEGEYGKLYAKNLKGWHFNLSHSGDLAVCAISQTPVGVDAELIARDCSIAAGKYFTESETELANKYGTSYIWTRKEAVAKADGRGIGIGIDKIDTSGDVCFSDSEEYKIFTNSVENYYISVACR